MTWYVTKLLGKTRRFVLKNLSDLAVGDFQEGHKSPVGEERKLFTLRRLWLEQSKGKMLKNDSTRYMYILYTCIFNHFHLF